MELLKEGTKAFSIFYEKCPRCQHGNLFRHSPYNLPHFAEMHDTCSYCGLSFRQEPSFYFGSMYISYAFQVMIIVATYVSLRVLIDPTASVYIITSLVLTLITMPLSFRLSRSAWINIFISYRKPTVESPSGQSILTECH